MFDLAAHQQQADAGGVHRIAHHFAQPADVLRNANAHRHLQHFFRKFDHAFHLRRTAGEHHAGAHQCLKAGAAQFRLHHFKNFFITTLHRLRQRVTRQAARRAIADARHLNAFLRGRQLRQRAAVADFDLLGFRRRCAQHVCNVIGDVVARDRQRRGVADRAMHKHRDVGGAGTDVDQHHAQLTLVAGQHRGAGGQRGEDQIVHLQPAALHAFADVGGGGLRADHQVCMYFEAHASHADRIADAFLRIVQYIVARDRVEDFLIGRNCHGFGRFQHAVEIGVAHLAVADRHDAR